MSNIHERLDKQIAEGTAIEALRKRSVYEHNIIGSMPIMQRFVVLETIFDPTIIDDVKINYYQHTLGVTNIKYAKYVPRNTVIAKKVLDTKSAKIPGSMFLFPLFPPNLALPCQPGEHVWVMFEDPNGSSTDLGYWMCRIVEPWNVDDINHTHAPRSLDDTIEISIKDAFNGNTSIDYEFRNGQATKTKDGIKYTKPNTELISGREDEYEKLMLESDGGKLNTYEPVPRFKKRPSDVAIEGSNNTLIVLGKDRTSDVANYSLSEKGLSVDDLQPIPQTDAQGSRAGAIDLVAGRGQTPITLGNIANSKFISGAETGFSEILKSDAIASEGNPDFLNDKSRIYIAQKTKGDNNLQLESINANLSEGEFQGSPQQLQEEKSKIENSPDGDGYIVIKSDKLRFIARSDIEILVTSYIEKDANGNYISSTNSDDYAVLAIKANGNIIFRPAKHGYIKLGGDDANKGLVCSDIPVEASNGNISGPPLVTTMGGLFAGSNIVGDDNTPALSQGQAKFANKILSEMSITEGCQYHAGVIDANGKLKQKPKRKFIQECKDELTFGTDNLPTPQLFPCGPKLQPIKYANLLDLENEEKFPEFHSNILGAYEKIANILNLKSDFKFLPICCPVSLGFKLGVNLKLKFPGDFIAFIFPNLPELALKLELLPPIELSAKFPTLPSIPPPIPKFDIPPDIKFPDFSTLFDFNYAFSIGIPKFLLNLALEMPRLILKLPNLPELFSFACDLGFKSNIFGDIKPTSVTQIAAVKILTKKVVEMTLISAVGTTLGSSPAGITGNLGRYLEYEPPIDDTESSAISVRSKIVDYALSCANLSWGKNKEEYTQKLLYTEYGDGTPKNIIPAAHDYDPRVIGAQAAIQKCSLASSCGMLARACLFAAGASYIFEYNGRPLLSKVPTKDPNVKLFYNFYSDEYRVLPGGGIAIAGLIQSAQKKNALYNYNGKGDLPPVKKGDVIIIHNPKENGTDHAMVVIEDYVQGSLNLKTVEGGQIDSSNKNRPTAIWQKEYVDESLISNKDRKINESPFGMLIEYATNNLIINGRAIKYIINSEILCNSTIGADYTGPHSALDVRLAADNNDNLNPLQFIAEYFK